jgi:ketosteroid isomerase-like protein
VTEWSDVWDDYELDVEDIRSAPDGREVMKMAQVATLRDGKVTRIDNYENRAKALEAAGLRAG